jgi:plasmid stability protein
MANLTLSLDDDLPRKVRATALRENASVNALVREYLKRYVDAKNRCLQALDALAERMVSAKRGQSPFYTFE